MEDHTDMVRCSDGKWRSPGPGPMPPEHAFKLQDVSLEPAPVPPLRWFDYVGMVFEAIFGFFIDNWGPLLICLIVMVTLAFFVVLFLGYTEERNSPSFTLQKDEWVCSMEHTQVSSSFIYTGKTMIPIVTSGAVCDRYDRRIK